MKIKSFQTRTYDICAVPVFIFCMFVDIVASSSLEIPLTNKNVFFVGFCTLPLTFFLLAMQEICFGSVHILP